MKKIIAWALSLILCLCALPVLAEEDAGETEIPEDILEEIEAALAEAEAQREEDPVPSPVGEWYALDDGLAVKLTLKEDGGYILIYPAFPEERTEGAWTLDDGFVYLDLDEDAVFSFDVDRLACHWLNLSFTREPVEDYAPADIIADALPELFDGAWLTVYTLENGAALPQSWTEDDTRIYVEQNTAVLTGSLFGELIVGLSIENGALIFQADGIFLRMEMQEDGLLRLTAKMDEMETVLLLAPYVLDAFLPTEEAIDAGF